MCWLRWRRTIDAAEMIGRAEEGDEPFSDGGNKLSCIIALICDPFWGHMF